MDALLVGTFYIALGKKIMKNLIDIPFPNNFLKPVSLWLYNFKCET